MKIVSTFDRKPGEVIDMNTVVYEFTKDAEGRFVLEVNDPAHCARLLSLPEAFALHPDEMDDAPEPETDPEPESVAETVLEPVAEEAAEEVAALEVVAEEPAPARRGRRSVAE